MRPIEVHCSPLTKTIFAGRTNDKGAWSGPKYDVTKDVINAVVDHIGTGKKLELRKEGLPSIDLMVVDADKVPDNAAVAAIEFALEDHDAGMTFLHMWNYGEFDKIRAEWPNCPVEVFRGADPLFKET
jgi:hypothetical protein